MAACLAQSPCKKAFPATAGPCGLGGGRVSPGRSRVVTRWLRRSARRAGAGPGPDKAVGGTATGTDEAETVALDSPAEGRTADGCPGAGNPDTAAETGAAGATAGATARKERAGERATEPGYAPQAPEPQEQRQKMRQEARAEQEKVSERGKIPSL